MAATTPEWIIAFDAKRFTERKREKEKKKKKKKESNPRLVNEIQKWFINRFRFRRNGSSMLRIYTYTLGVVGNGFSSGNVPSFSSWPG